MGIGEFAALGTALLWTISSMIWGQIHLSAVGINLCKNWLGSALIVLHLVVLAKVSSTPVFAAPAQSWGFLALSGVIGIVIGDTLYFRSLQILGPRRALLVASTSPLFAVILGWSFLHEALPLLATSGIVMTVVGVAVVVLDRRAKQESPGIMPGSLTAGIVCGVLAATCQAAGGVFSKLGMLRVIDGEPKDLCGPLEATFIRLFIAAIGTLILVFAKKELPKIVQALRNEASSKMIVPATICGTWVGIWLSQIAFKEASAVAIAQTLLSTCPLFAIPLVWWLHRHRTTWYSMVGTILALIGIYLTVR